METMVPPIPATGAAPPSDAHARPRRERRVTLGHIPLRIRHPADPAALIDAIDPDLFASRDERIPYWADVWPSAVALGRHLIALDLGGLRVIELGAGVGVAGLAAARAGAEVLVTDYEPDALAFAQENAELNGLGISTQCLDWRDPGWPGGFDLVVAADVVYESRNVAPLAGLVPRLLAPGGRALIADPRRPYAGTLSAALEERGLSVSTRPLYLYWQGRAHEIDLIAARRPAAGRAGQATAREGPAARRR
jgi:predicted nicotinamide N-methyase